MNKIQWGTIITLLILSIIPVSAKIKIQNVCPMLKFEGELVKNTTTKLKEPSGQGLLFVPVRNGKQPKDALLSINGTFQGNTITQAVICVKDEEIYKGRVSYDYTYNKSSKRLEIKVEYNDGVLSVGEKGHSFNVTSESPMTYIFLFEEDRSKDGHFSIIPSETIITYHSQEYPTDRLSVIGNMIVDNEWSAKWEHDKWVPIWSQGTLKNGMTVSALNGLSFKGPNGTYLSHGKLKLPLLDGGYFEWNKEKRVIRLTNPSGEIFEGTFSKVPFEFINGYSSNSGIFSLNSEYNDRKDGSVNLYTKIINSYSTNFIPFDGAIIFPDGKREIVFQGLRLESEGSVRTNDGYHPSNFDEIAKTHVFVNHDGEWVYLINGQQTHKNGIDGEELFHRLSGGLLKYAGKQDADALEQSQYLSSDQSKTDKFHYENLRRNTLFYSIQSVKSKFSTSSVTLNIDDRDGGYISKFNILGIGKGPYVPFKGDCKYNWSTYDITIPIKDVEILKLLKEREGHLKLLVTYKAGEWNDFARVHIANPIALYIYDSASGALLYDCSHLLGAYSSKEIQRKTATAINEEKTEEQKREAERKGHYHNQAKRIRCAVCSGKGYWEDEGFDSNSVWRVRRNRCTSCYGKGYVDTHYY